MIPGMAVVALGGVGLALAAFSTPADASASDSSAPTDTTLSDIFNSDTSSNPFDFGDPAMDNTTNENLQAFLAVLRLGESAGDYGALVGGGRFTDLSHHPGFTNASMTAKSTWAGWHNSHAAGAYQFQPATFKECSDALGLHGSMDNASQDAAAVFLIKRRNAYSAVLSGDIDTACALLTNEWQSLPVRGVGWVSVNYEQNGGTLA